MTPRTKECELCKGAKLYPDNYRAGVKHRRLVACPLCMGQGRLYTSNHRPVYK